MVACIYCLKYYLSPLLADMRDFQSYGIAVQGSGVTSKLDRGYLLLECKRSIPDSLHEYLRRTQSVIDYMLFDSALPSGV
jgi:hypothetical protein